jgi:hypothetical protein
MSSQDGREEGELTEYSGLETREDMTRLHVRGLPQGVTAKDVAQRFSPFGNVTVLEFVLCKHPERPQAPGASIVATPPFREDSTVHDCRFAYVELQPRDESTLARCISMVNSFSAVQIKF